MQYCSIAISINKGWRHYNDCMYYDYIVIHQVCFIQKEGRDLLILLFVPVPAVYIHVQTIVHECNTR